MSFSSRIIKAPIIFCAALSILSLLTSDSYSQLTSKELPDRTGIRIGGGNIRLHSALKLQEDLDTNVFLQDTDTKADFITLVSPSIGLDIPLRDNNISLDYETGIYMYGTYNSQNHIDQKLRGLAEINLSDYKVTVKDTLDIFTNRASNENSVRLRQVDNTFRTGVEAQFELLGFDVGYSNIIETYSSNDIFYQSLTYEDKDRDLNIIDATLSYRFMPKTLFLLENDLGLVHYYNNSQVPGSFYDETLAGIKGEWFKKIYVNFKAGARVQFYEKSDVINHKSYIGPVLRGGFDYFISDDDTLTVGAQKTVYESLYNNMNYYDANIVAIDYEHKFNDKMTGKLFTSWQINLYPGESTENGVTAKRYDNYYAGGASLTYNVRKWLTFEAKYEYVQKISIFDIFDYKDNIASIRGTVGF